MTNEELAGVGKLVAWLREEADLAHYRAEEDMLTEAADTIQSLAAQLAEARAENERLREALRELVEEYVHNVDSTRLGGFYLNPETEDCVIDARAALARAKEASHDAD